VSVKIYYYSILKPQRTQSAQSDFTLFLCPSVVNCELLPAPTPSPALLPPPLAFTPRGCPSLSAPPAFVVGVGAGRRFFGALWMNEYPPFPGCGMYVVFVRCRRLLKYIIYEILHHKEPKAMAVESFAVNQIMKPSPPPSPCSPAAPSSLHYARVPLPVCSIRPCGVEAGAFVVSRGCVRIHFRLVVGGESAAKNRN